MPNVRNDGRKHPNAFDAYLDDRFVCTNETPLFSSARILLEDRTAQSDDRLIMRHVGSDHDAFRAKVGVVAKLSIRKPALDSADQVPAEKWPAPLSGSLQD